MLEAALMAECPPAMQDAVVMPGQVMLQGAQVYKIQRAGYSVQVSMLSREVILLILGDILQPLRGC